MGVYLQKIYDPEIIEMSLFYNEDIYQGLKNIVKKG